LRCQGCNLWGGFRIKIFDEKAAVIIRSHGWSGWSRGSDMVNPAPICARSSSPLRFLEVSIGRMAERLEKIEKRQGMLPADRLESATV